MLRSLTGKLTLGVALFLALLALVTASTISVTITSAALSKHLVEDTLLFVHHSDLFNLHTARALAETEAFLRTRERSEADNAREQLAAAQDQLTILEALASLADRTAAEQAASDALIQRQQRLLDSSELHIATVFAAIALRDQNQLAEALEAIERTKDQFAELEAETTALLNQEAANAIDTVNAQNQQGLVVTPFGFGVLGLAALLTLWLLRRFIVRPIRDLSAAAGAVASGDLSQKVPITSTDEIGELQTSFIQMVNNLAAQRSQVEEQQQALAQRASELEHTLAELQTSTQERDQLSQSIRELSTPVLPISNGILVMPLIGAIDTQRAAMLMQTLLSATERHKATTVILDVTGVPLIDTMVARGLLQAAQAIQLLGAQTILVGLRPELAQTITGLGLSLSGIVAQADLQSGLAHAMQRRH